MMFGCCALEAFSFLKGDRGGVYPGKKRCEEGEETIREINL